LYKDKGYLLIKVFKYFYFFNSGGKWKVEKVYGFGELKNIEV